MSAEIENNAMILDGSRKHSDVSRTALRRLFERVAVACWNRLHGIGSRPVRQLRLRESLGLGDRRFVAVVEFEERRFLVGGTSGSIVLLARLDGGRGDGKQSTQEEGGH
jgi:Flagellar biosynthesis protein, FliO